MRVPHPGPLSTWISPPAPVTSNGEGQLPGPSAAEPGPPVPPHDIWETAAPGDATEAIIAQIERFAPGFRDRIVGKTVRTTTQMAAYNPNYVGGDIMTGSKDILQLTFGPRITLSPYKIGVPGMYICSAATPPGPGAHGMCGANAADVALSELT